MPEAEQGLNLARIISLRAELPVEASAMTINRYCASGLQSIALAVERIRGGSAEVIVAGGAESMSMIPMGGNKISANPWLVDHYPDSYLSMGLTAERVAKHYGISREESDRFALASHQKALAAIGEGKFEDEIVPVTVTISDPSRRRRSSKQRNAEFRVDEGPRKDTILRGAGEASAGISRAWDGDGRKFVADFGRSCGRSGRFRGTRGCSWV